MKKGGFSKKWIWRYFVLYRTAMGHILCYYADHTETASAISTVHSTRRSLGLVGGRCQLFTRTHACRGGGVGVTCWWLIGPLTGFD